jgi:hypothetical protein
MAIVASKVCWAVTPCNGSFCMILEMLLLHLLLYPEDGPDMFLRDIDFLQTT